MTTKLKLCLVALYACLSISSAQAQAPPALESLFRLDGNWEGPAVLDLGGGNIFNFTYYANFQRNEESTGMTMDETFTHPDLGTLKGYNLIGYNARDEKIHWFSVDNFGTCHDHQGYWKTPDHFYMETTEKHGGKKFEEKIDIIFISPTQISLHLVATVGGQVVQEASVTFTKQAAPINIAVKSPCPEKGINEIFACKVFPNPASGEINFQLPEIVIPGNLQLSILNVTGIKLKEISLRSSTTNVSLAGFKPGAYFYRVSSQGKLLYSGEIIVQ